MRYLLTILTIFTLLGTGCDKKTTESEETGDLMEYSTINVKTATEYFSFASNSGSTDDTSEHDMVFYSSDWLPPGSPSTIKDPRFKIKEGLSAAVINTKNLDDVTEVPNSANFVTNFISEFGEWYTQNSQTFLIIPQEKVYVVNTPDGKFPAFQIKSYYDDRGVSGVYTIEWKYLNY